MKSNEPILLEERQADLRDALRIITGAQCGVTALLNKADNPDPELRTVWLVLTGLAKDLGDKVSA
jgi:hypothetical protein